MRLGFREDTRAVSALVGAILLLAILIIALSSYQAVIVPQQNAQTEFDHNQQVEDEMVDLRNALLEARLDNRERATSVKLGTRYQSRTLAVNPPPATGILQSTGQDDISVDGDNIDSFDLTGNQFFEYTPSYSEYRDAGTIRYENTLVYHDFGSDNITLSNQRLLTDESPSGFDVDGKIRLVPSEPDIDEQGIDRVSYEPTPERARFVTVTDPEITLPTELAVESQDRTNWEDLLGGQVDESEISEGPNGELVLELDGNYLIKYSFVAGQDTSVFPVDERDPVGDGDDGAAEINPAAPGNIQLVGVDWRSPSNSEVTMSFKNIGSTESSSSFVSGRVSFYFSDTGNSPSSVTNMTVDGSDRINGPWQFGQGFRTIDDISFAGGEEKDVTMGFNVNNIGSRGFFVLTLTIDTVDGTQKGTYFVGSTNFSPPPENGGNGGDDSGDEDDDGSENGGDEASAVSGVEGTVDASDIGGGGGSRVEFDITADREVTLTGFTVDTRNEVSGVAFNNEGSTFDGDELSVTFEGQIPVDLLDFDTNNIQNDLDEVFVDPDASDVNIIVTLEFSDGSERELGIR